VSSIHASQGAGSCECGNEHSGTIRHRSFYSLRHYKHSAAWNSHISEIKVTRNIMCVVEQKSLCIWCRYIFLISCTAGSSVDIGSTGTALCSSIYRLVYDACLLQWRYVVNTALIDGKQYNGAAMHNGYSWKIRFNTTSIVLTEINAVVTV
jgi:hypothetical protein